ncbi:hypothetical protein NPIL_687351 [Nephila pilipes]|uniref:Uncharacterized protein n=1 Tax=Nephila pilipes TaxID=299642 RepID=A0A8X6UEG7_NEPPI|nr:hypothetical protein NPIL_687351 [Nephila pilipes]
MRLPNTGNDRHQHKYTSLLRTAKSLLKGLTTDGAAIVSYLSKSAYFSLSYNEISSPCSTCLYPSCWPASWLASLPFPTVMSLDTLMAMVTWDITTWTTTSTMSTTMTSIISSRNKEDGPVSQVKEQRLGLQV